MSQANVNAAELRRFAALLHQHNTQLTSISSQMQAQLSTLMQTWRDVKGAKFQSEFTQFQATLKHFVGQSEEYAHYCQMKAGQIEPYSNSA